MTRLIRQLLLVALALWLGLAARPVQACSTGGCVAAGPRLASLSSTRGVLLDAVMGRLTDSSVTLGVGDWNNIAAGSVSVARTLSALQAALSLSTPSDALNANISISTLLTAAASAATANQQGMLAASLNNAATAFAGAGGTIRLGQLLQTDGGLGTTQINAMELLSGTVQLYNTRNVVNAPAIGLTGSALGLSGLLNNLSLSMTVVEPPVYACGPTGTGFHTATVRVKLNIDLVSIALASGALDVLLGEVTSLKVTHLDLYFEVARADGVLGIVDAIAKTMKVSATPGVADVYLGIIPDALFINRSRPITAADLNPGVLAELKLLNGTIAIYAKATAKGSPTGGASTLNFTGPYPQTLTAAAQGGFVSTLLGSLVGNLTLSISPSLLGLENLVLGALKTIFQTGLGPILTNVVSNLLNPLLEMLGVRLGEVDVTAGGTFTLCTVSGCVYQDANHSGLQDSTETGTATTLYAKLVDPATPGAPATAVATVDPSTGMFTFPAAATGAYTVVVNSSPLVSTVTPAPPAGWLATEAPTMSFPLTLATDMTGTAGRRIGLFHGSKVSGTVFNDNGINGGTANNGVREPGEAAVPGIALKAVDGGSTALLDGTTSGDAGNYTLWLPWTSATVKVAETVNAGWVSVGGNAGTTGGAYVRATDTTTFTAAAGTAYTGVDFADVPVSRFDSDSQQTVAPGGTAYHAHAFTAGSAGLLSLLPVATAPSPGWTTTPFTDANCDGKLDSGDTAITTAVPVVANQRVCVLLKVFAPATATYDERQPLAVTARLALSNHTLQLDHQRLDLTLVGRPGDTGLRLTKTVDRVAARKGDTIVYTITYANQGADAIGALKIFDATPAYTVLLSAACGPTPAPTLVCSVTTKPAAAAAGAVAWSFAGELPAGASGTVVLSVVLD